ncbi:MAG TPA: heme-binding protein, partial [Rhizomicrobium sp.]|nr:heme-binding protein [Rhizomicrobium sp.]
AAQGYSETAVLVDTDGVVQASLRGDGSGIHTIDSAHDKAYTAVTFKRDTMPLMSAPPRESDVLFARLPHMLRAGGGVVIKSGTITLGAIGASGAPGYQFDDACAKAGVAKIMDRLK